MIKRLPLLKMWILALQSKKILFQLALTHPVTHINSLLTLVLPMLKVESMLTNTHFNTKNMTTFLLLVMQLVLKQHVHTLQQWHRIQLLRTMSLNSFKERKLMVFMMDILLCHSFWVTPMQQISNICMIMNQLK
jgi:hypothetical protein